jgi:hypothetical protein
MAVSNGIQYRDRVSSVSMSPLMFPISNDLPKKLLYVRRSQAMVRSIDCYLSLRAWRESSGREGPLSLVLFTAVTLDLTYCKDFGDLHNPSGTLSIQRLSWSKAGRTPSSSLGLWHCFSYCPGSNFSMRILGTLLLPPCRFSCLLTGTGPFSCP